MTKFVIQVFFLQNALVEYIGVYSDTNKIPHLNVCHVNHGTSYIT